MKRSLKSLLSSISQFWTKNKPVNPKKWQQHLLSLYIVRSNDGICLFSHHFKIGLISQIETQLVGMGFTALLKMVKEIVDANSTIKFIDLENKKVLMDEREHFSSFLIATDNSPLIREKLLMLTDYFEKIFELQRQISYDTYVCLEDYALTSDLVSLIFETQSNHTLDIIPIIFKSIQKSNLVLFRGRKKSQSNRTLNKFIIKFPKN